MNSESVLNVTSNPFSRVITDIFSDIIDKRLKTKVEEKESNKPYSYSEEEKYVSSLFLLHIKILSTFETLSTISIYLNNLPPKKILEKHDIPKSQYYQYHIESHIIRITTLFDQLVLFVNRLYDLGIDPKKCSAELVFNNEHTKKSKEVQLLKELYKSINSIKGARNLIVHRGEFSDSELDDIATRELFKRNKSIDEEISEGLKMYIYMEAYVSKRYKINKIKEIVKNNKFLEKFLITFFTYSLKTFAEKYPNDLK